VLRYSSLCVTNPTSARRSGCRTFVGGDLGVQGLCPASAVCMQWLAFRFAGLPGGMHHLAPIKRNESG
jgi:hypothetical protein